MSYRTPIYVIAGSKVPVDWGVLPTDGQNGKDPYDDWHDRWGHLKIHEAKPGDIVFLNDMDRKHWAYIGLVLAVHNDLGDFSSFNESFDETRFLDVLDEACHKLLAADLDLYDPIKLHIVSVTR